MTGLSCLENYFLPLSRRTPPAPCFYRVIGRDTAGELLTFLRKYYHLTRSQGIYLNGGLSNPAEPEIQRFYQAAGEAFSLSPQLFTRHMTVWLGQLKPLQREMLSNAIAETLELLQKQGANQNIIKNAYIKFMCWFRSSLGHVLVGIGQDAPPKVLFEGAVSKYDVFLLHLLHLAGCDVLYVNFVSEAQYLKTDPHSKLSEPVYLPEHTPPPVPFTVEQAPPKPAPDTHTPAAPVQKRQTVSPQQPARQAAQPPRPAPWTGMAKQVEQNAWSGEMPPWDAVLKANSERGPLQPIHSLFYVVTGIDERTEYRNRLFHLRGALERSGRKWILLQGKVSNPDAAEAAVFRNIQKNLNREQLIGALTELLSLSSGKVQTLLAQYAFYSAMGRITEKDPVRFLNYGIRLACWLKRYADTLFDGYRGETQPVLLFYGEIREQEAVLLWTLGQMGADVLSFCTDTAAAKVFESLPLDKTWNALVLGESAPVEPFPEREERMRASTSAYNASRELDKLLYTDTGMFRDRQFARSSPVTLKTTYDEVGQLWAEEAQYRPSFRTVNGVVYVPNLFAKISGVDKGDAALYWNKIRGMITEDTYVACQVPFLWTQAPSMPDSQARAFLHNGKLDPKALKASRFYQYDYLPDDTQDYILEKIQALIDYDLIIGDKETLPAAMLSVLMNLDKEILRLLQNFDFTRTVPKFLVIDLTEIMFTLQECILLAFLNLVGFDIAIFTPTGYKNIEKYLRSDSFETHIVGEFRFDLTVPDLHTRRKNNSSGDWFSRIFGAGR